MQQRHPQRCALCSRFKIIIILLECFDLLEVVRIASTICEQDTCQRCALCSRFKIIIILLECFDLLEVVRIASTICKQDTCSCVAD